ncbi:MAG: MFS transporter [Deltaproteobacteria bacterium]|nr:MFS transporter [Deltaproteobacteria bacterium]
MTADVSVEKRTRFDGWLAGICASRVFNGLVFMSYAAALPVLQREWEMSAAQAGAIASGFQMGYAVSLVVFSSVADRISPKRLYLWSLFTAGVFSLGFAFFARGFASALVLHTVVGISLGGTYTTGVMIIADQYVARHRGMAVGFFIASTSCGYAFSLAISGVAIPVGGYTLSFLLTCLGPILGWFRAWITLRRTAVPAAGRRKEQRFTREVLGNRPAMLLIWGYICHNWELLGMWSWTPAFLAACLAQAGSMQASAAGYGAFITASFHFVGLLASFSMGALSDRMDRARILLILAAAGMACSFLFGWSAGWPLALVVGIGLVYAFTALGDSPVLSAALTEEVDAACLGVALGFRSLVGFGAGAVAPVAFGVVLDWTNPVIDGQRVYADWGWAFSVLGLGGGGAAWAAFRFGRSRRQETRGQLNPAGEKET